MNVILLHPTDIEEARETIMENINRNPVFVVTSEMELHKYIPALQLKEKIQSRMRICKEMKIHVRLHANGQTGEFRTLSRLLENIDLSDGECEVVVLGDVNVTEAEEKEVRCQLCGIIQQLIYLNLQLSQVHVCTEKEELDNERIRKFERGISRYKKCIQDSVRSVERLEDDKKKHVKEILGRLELIRRLIAETQNNELKIAVAATKKSGKSVIVNSMLGCEIAPTSSELPTPNNCVYSKSPDDKYHLDFDGTKKESGDREEIRSFILEQFQIAEEKYEDGLAIPDMKIEYPQQKESGFSSFTVYDTPGPNFGPETTMEEIEESSHAQAAKRGVDAADVIVFTIDYTKHLEADEYKYLKSIWQMCQEKGKRYSLILNVNKLDERYINPDDKCVVRIVDKIRSKFINFGKQDGIDFRDCVVVGTSALTYFNAIAAPSFHCPTETGDCRILETDFSLTALDELIDAYDEAEDKRISSKYETEAVSALAQLGGMLRHASVWHKTTITSLQEMKQFSGMPNLLSYVDYIATQKARAEKVNHLLFRIDSECRAIRNLFHIENLITELRNNKAQLEEAKKILGEFEKAVREILDSEYTDLYLNYNNRIYPDNANMRSAYLAQLTEKRPVHPAEVVKLYAEQLDKDFGLQKVLDTVTQQPVETLLARKLRELYGNDGTLVLRIDSILDHYTECLSQACVEAMNTYINDRKDKRGQELEVEQEAIAATFTYVWDERLRLFREAVLKYSERLNKECNVELIIEVPVIAPKLPDFTNNDFNLIVSKLAIADVRDGVKAAMESLNRYNDGKTTGFVGWLRKTFGAENRIVLSNVMKVYQTARLDLELEMAYKKNGTLEVYLRDKLRNPMVNAMKKFITDMQTSIEKNINRNLQDRMDQIRSIIDDTAFMEKTVEELEHEKITLDLLKAAVEEFVNAWSEVIDA